MPEPQEFDEIDQAQFDEGFAHWNAGRTSEAIRILEDLASRRPKQASVSGVLASIFWEINNLERCIYYARLTVGLSPGSELASRVLVHALVNLRALDDAFAEMARFRSLKTSAEYDLLLAEWELDTLREIEKAPLDPFHERMLAAVRDELRQRPIKQ